MGYPFGKMRAMRDLPRPHGAFVLDSRTAREARRTAQCRCGIRADAAAVVNLEPRPQAKYRRRSSSIIGTPAACGTGRKPSVMDRYPAPLYKPGPTRKVPGRNGMSYEEPDWVDENDTSHRRPDE
jgi:hypothetical protein